MPKIQAVPSFETLSRVIKGRLLVEWMRCGKEVPEGFGGSLQDYATVMARILADEVEGDIVASTTSNYHESSLGDIS